MINEGLEVLGTDEYPGNDGNWYGVFGDSALEYIELPSTLKKIEYSAFSGCKNLRNIHLPERLGYIGEWCFQESGLESVTLSSSLKTVENRTFYQCKNLKKVIFEKGSKVEKIGSSCFQNSGLEEITLPKALKEVGLDTFQNCENLRTIYVEDGCEAWLLGTGILDSTQVSPLPEAMVGSQRVWDLRKCKHVVIPEGAERIGNHWFYGCGIESVEIPASVKYIDACAFCDC